MNNGMEKEIFEIYVDDIIPNRFQPRLAFDEKSLQDLSASIKEHGIIQPLVLRKIGDKYEIIAGERRYKAAIMAGLQKVPAILMNLDDNKSAEIAVVENTQRKDLTPLEEAKSYKKLLDRKYLTQEQLAARMGKSQSYISNKMRLLNLDEEVQDALLNEKISERHARSLLSLNDPMQQKDVLNKIITGKLTVKQTDSLIKDMTGTVVPSTDESSGETAEIISNQSNPIPSFDQEQPLPNNMPIFNDLDTTQPIDSVAREKEAAVDINPVREQPNFEQLLNLNNSQSVSDVPNMTFNNPVSPQPSVEPINPVPPVVETMNNKFISPVDMEKDETNMSMGDILAANPNEDITPSQTINVNDVTTPVNPVETPINDPLPNNEDNFNPNDSTNTSSLIQEYRDSHQSIIPNLDVIPGNLNSAINYIREAGKALEKSGFVLDVEEFDFEHLYQLIIKIQKK